MSCWVVFGGGGHSRSVVDALLRANAEVIAIVDPAANESQFPTVRLDSEGAALARERNASCLVAIGDNDTRLAILTRLAGAQVDLSPFTASTATVSPDAILGRGTVVLEHAHVGPASRLGAGCIVNTSAVVEHDCVIGDGVHLAPGSVLGGQVQCDRLVLVGTGAVILPNAHIEEEATVGAGAIVLKSVPARSVVVGTA